MPAGIRIEVDPEKSYLLWRNAMAGRTDEFEARLTKMWRRYKRDALNDGAMVRKALRAQEIKLLRRPGTPFIAPGMHTVGPFRDTVDRTLASWLDKEFRRLRLFPSKNKAKSIEVFNRLWDASQGGPKTVIEIARKAARTGVMEAGGVLSPGERKRMAKAMEQAEESGFAHQQSWTDNVVRALEQAKYQASIAFKDATAGLNPESAINDAITKFAPPLGVLGLSYMTHPRAAYRSTIAAACSAVEANDYMYYLPTSARVDANPSGFGAEHYAQIRTVRQWEALRRKLGHKKAGSFIFTTGFHVGDLGYLLPIPLALLEAARETERKTRQKWLESLKEDAA
jgi:hypothetical protein